MRLIVTALAAACAILPLAPRHVWRASAGNTMEVVVAGGPHTGTYHAPAGVMICMRLKAQKQLVASFRNFDAHDAKGLSEGGLTIDNPDQPGEKRGEVRIAFGDPDKAPTVYDLHVPADSKGPLTLTSTPEKADIGFQGHTKDGVSLRVTVACTEFEKI